MFEKGSCSHCSGHIEFDSEHAGQMVACPHCGLETKLSVDALDKASPPSPRVVPSSVGVEIKREVNPLGIASLVLGIIACLFCWIPFLGLFVIPLSAIGLLLALVGLIMASANKKTGFVFPISGGIVCLLSIVIALVMTGGFAVLIQKEKASTEVKSVTQTDEPKANSNTSADQGSQNITPMTFQQGNIKVKINDVVHGFQTGESPTERGLIVKTSNFLLITVGLLNTSSNRIYDYMTFRDNALLTDDKGNTYQKIESHISVYGYIESPRDLKNLPGWAAPYPFQDKRYQNSSRIRPGNGRVDMLGFNIPDAPGNVLYLDLSAENFGGTGKMRFEIPVSRIKNW